MSKYALPEIQELRAAKTAKEIFCIKRAQRISEQVLRQVLFRLRVEVSEIALARFIVSEFKKQGVKALAFEPIVAFGKNTADIHHWAGSTKLKKGDTVMFDFGCTYKGYCSDMTRTYFFGKPTSKQKKVYTGVLQAQERALKILSSGEKQTKVVDLLARNFLTRKFGKNSFPHGLGHGIGTVIHEWPNFKPKSPDLLKPGMVMTVEPGVYLKGWGGVRIEDMVIIKSNGIENLTKISKDLNSAVIFI